MLEILKIDACFVRAIGKNKRKEKILTSIINLAQTLDMEVVAEGVETEFQLQTIRKNQCKYAQGYLFAKPNSSEEIEDLLTIKFQKITRACWYFSQ